jgi:hypothetical protein
MMQRMPKILAMVVALGAAFLFGRLMSRPWMGQEQTTLTSLSPDDSTRIQLVELPLFLDRDFELRLQDVKSGAIKTIFRSPDEGRPEGSERIIWSADGSKIILTGRHFAVREHTPTFDGAILYLMYDLPSGKIWCNASQQARFPSFELSDVALIKWSDER